MREEVEIMRRLVYLMQQKSYLMHEVDKRIRLRLDATEARKALNEALVEMNVLRWILKIEEA